jgi:hypothetical protein
MLRITKTYNLSMKCYVDIESKSASGFLSSLKRQMESLIEQQYKLIDDKESLERTIKTIELEIRCGEKS